MHQHMSFKDYFCVINSALMDSFFISRFSVIDLCGSFLVVDPFGADSFSVKLIFASTANQSLTFMAKVAKGRFSFSDYLANGKY